MGFCLPKFESEKFLDALRSGKISPEKMIDMTSEERRTALADIVGEENARAVNAELESKLILKDQQRGMVSWAKKVAGLTEPARRDIISKIEKLDRVLDASSQEAFLEDLAAKKLGTDVSFEEAKHIVDLSRHLAELKDHWDASTGEWASDEARLNYGATKIALQNFVDDMKLSNNDTTLRGIAKDFKTDPIAATKDGIDSLAGTAKGISASLDNSAIFRQGWRTMFTHSTLWAKNAIQSFRDIASQIGRKPSNNDIINGVKAEIQSRPNAMKGIYDKMKLDIGTNEEAYPTTLPEKIPVFGRLYKASETAYTGFLYRMRADIADKYIAMAENNGIDMRYGTTARGMGKLVNSLTGRGDLGGLEKVGKTVNSVFFSPKSFKASLDFLTGHVFDKEVRLDPFLRKQAAVNLLKVVAGTAVIMATAQAILGKDAVETDPTSSDFGKIKIGHTRFDYTGGMGSLVVLAARMLEGESKSTITHKKTSLSSGKFGSKTRFNVITEFAAGKASPAFGVLIDYAKGQTFEGYKPHLLPKNMQDRGEVVDTFTPLPIQNAIEVMHDPKGANALLTIIADGLGISTNTYGATKK